MTTTQNMSVVVTTCDGPARQRAWDAYVGRHPDAGCAHGHEWAAVMRAAFGHEPLGLIAWRGGEPVGVLPLVLIESRLFGRALVSSPYLTHGGVLASDESAAAVLVDAAVDAAGRRRAHYLELRNLTHHACPLTTRTRYSTLVLDLSPGIDGLWRAMDSNVRRNVRRARDAGLTVTEDRQRLGEFVEINARNMRRLGTPPHGRRFFEQVLAHMPDARLLTAWQDDRCVAGMLLIGAGHRLEMPWVAARAEDLHLRPNNLLYWHAMTCACEAGYRVLDFGRSKTESGTWRFKRQHGGAPVQLHYHYHLHRARRMPDFDPDNARFKPLIAAWRRMPMPVVRTLGPRLIAAVP